MIEYLELSWQPSGSVPGFGHDIPVVSIDLKKTDEDFECTYCKKLLTQHTKREIYPEICGTVRQLG
jgi:hypothetical protein